MASVRGQGTFRVTMTKSAQKLDAEGKQYTAYCIVVTSSEGRDTLWKRYSDFVKLDTELHAQYPDAPAELEGRMFFGIGLAARSLFNYDDVVKQRLAELPVYLDKWMPANYAVDSCPRPLADFLQLLGSGSATAAEVAAAAASTSALSSGGGGGAAGDGSSDGSDENADLPLIARHRLQRKELKIKELWALINEAEARASAVESEQASAVAAAVAVERQALTQLHARAKSDHTRAMQSLRAEYESQIKAQPKGIAAGGSRAVEAAIRRLQERLKKQSDLLKAAEESHAATLASEVAAAAEVQGRLEGESAALRSELAERAATAEGLARELAVLPQLKEALRVSQDEAVAASGVAESHRAAGVENDAAYLARIAAAEAMLATATREHEVTLASAAAAKAAAANAKAEHDVALSSEKERAAAQKKKLTTAHATALGLKELELKRAGAAGRDAEMRLTEADERHARVEAQRRKAVDALAAAEEATAAAASTASSAEMAHERVAAREAAHRKALADATERHDSEKKASVAQIRKLREECDALRARTAAAAKLQASSERDAAERLRGSAAAAGEARGALTRVVSDLKRELAAALAKRTSLETECAETCAELASVREAHAAGLAQLREQIEALRAESSAEEEDTSESYEIVSPPVLVSAAGAAMVSTAAASAVSPRTPPRAPPLPAAQVSVASSPSGQAAKATKQPTMKKSPRAAAAAPSTPTRKGSKSPSTPSRDRVASDQGLGSLMAGLRAASTAPAPAGKEAASSSSSSASSSSSSTAAAATAAKAAAAATAATATATAAATGRLLKSGFAGAGRLFKNATGITAQREQTAKYRARLVAFYSKHNPAKVAAVDELLGKYKNRELSLFAALESKYGKGSTDGPADEGSGAGEGGGGGEDGEDGEGGGEGEEEGEGGGEEEAK